MKNTSRHSVDLRGFTLTDQQGNRYRFAGLRLDGHSSVKVHTGHGRDTHHDVYQNRNQQIWDAHDTATLRDNRGHVIDTETWGRGHHHRQPPPAATATRLVTRPTTGTACHGNPAAARHTHDPTTRRPRKARQTPDDFPIDSLRPRPARTSPRRAEEPDRTGPNHGRPIRLTLWWPEPGGRRLRRPPPAAAAACRGEDRHHALAAGRGPAPWPPAGTTHGRPAPAASARPAATAQPAPHKSAPPAREEPIRHHRLGLIYAADPSGSQDPA
ncbi:lamin tail domain-containing protein [Streptomyces sp. RKAG293]|uniref:lamin tail domain-containing protein n=1 Tax=Streptomyces sp. RKAG293 TaxID=2893403 RepID=UPI0020336EA5|nr:lamin tail domain-containing protein [Streptomyces sp. RKAG293]MCM2416686.1 lamin tail domain-containing protein [Streptomyces sp. RKAG293]